MHDLYLCMRLAGDKQRLKELRHDLSWDKSHHQADAAKLLDLHRQEHDAHLSELNEAEKDLDKAKNGCGVSVVSEREFTQSNARYERAKEQYGEALEKYYEAVLSDSRAVMKRWAAQMSAGKVNQEEIVRGVVMMLDVAKTFPAKMRLTALKEYQLMGAISNQQFDQALGEAAHSARDEWAEDRKKGRFDAQEQKNVQEQLQEIILALPNERRQKLVSGLPLELRLEVLEAERLAGKLAAPKHEDELVAIVLAARKEWAEEEKKQSLDHQEQQRCLSKIKHLLSSLPPERRRIVKEGVDRVGSGSIQ